MFCLIYKITNQINNKIYIGQTWRSISFRWKSGNGYKGSKHLNLAIQKHGKDNFCYTVLTVAHTQDIADYWESYFIALYDSSNRDLGYNLKSGGSHGKHSEETKIKIGETSKGRFPSEITRNKMSISRTGQIRNEQQRKNISAALTGLPKSEEHKTNLSIALTGKTLPQEVKDKISFVKKGVPFTEEHKTNISAALTGKVKDKAHVEKIAAAKRGKHYVLTEDQISQIIKDPRSGIALSKEYGVSASTISKLRRDNKE